MNSNVKPDKRTSLGYVIATLLGCVLVASTTHADEQVRSQSVSFADLNVNTPAGARVLYDRIHSAAERVCADSDPLQRLAAGPCARKAEANAIEKLNLPQLTAYYRAKTGKATEPLTATR